MIMNENSKKQSNMDRVISSIENMAGKDGNKHELLVIIPGAEMIFFLCHFCLYLKHFLREIFIF